MATINQTTANQANAQHSTGPKSPEGKKKSSLNSLRHGLNAQAVLLPHEDALAFLRHSKEWFDGTKPQGPIEKQLVQSLVDLSWRINRMRNMETNILAASYHALSDKVQASDPEVHTSLTMARAVRECEDSIVKLGVHEQRASRTFERTLKQLHDIQAERRAHENRQLHDASRIHRMNTVKKIEWNPAEFGFVPSIPQIEAFTRRETLVDQAYNFQWRSAVA